jgi:Protein of unknown function (DUF2281)
LVKELVMEKVAKLPANLRSKVSDFVDILLAKEHDSEDEINRPVFGSGKGMFVMKPGFDDPLEDFKEYM